MIDYTISTYSGKNKILVERSRASFFLSIKSGYLHWTSIVQKMLKFLFEHIETDIEKPVFQNSVIHANLSYATGYICYDGSKNISSLFWLFTLIL